MEIDPKTYPSRTFIRFTAHKQLWADATGNSMSVFIQRFNENTYVQQIRPKNQAPLLPESAADVVQESNLEALKSVDNLNDLAVKDTNDVDDKVDEDLFREVVNISFNPNRYPELYQSCGTFEGAKCLEAKVIAEIVSVYCQIKQKQNCPIVQRLNQLI